MNRTRWMLLILAAGGIAVAHHTAWPTNEVSAQAPSQSGSPSGRHQGYPLAGEVDLKKSRVYVFVGKTGFGHEHGIEGRVKSGHITLGAEKVAGEVVFDMKRFDADTSAARRYVGLPGSVDRSTRRQVNANMLGADVLDVRRYPTATFEIGSALPLKQSNSQRKAYYQLNGTFTLHGVKRPLRVTAELTKEKETAHLRGAFTIHQTSFGITPFSKAFGAVGVKDQLKIHGDIWLKAATTQTATGTHRKRSG